MRAAVERFLKDDSGATAIEYAMIGLIIGIGIISGLRQLPNALNTLWSNVNSNL